MTLLEDVKKSVEGVSGWRRPSSEQLATLLRSSRPRTYYFRDDGFISNNSFWPLLVYSSAFRLPRSLDPAAGWEAAFESNGWGDCWRGEIYDYLHYHSGMHEVLGIARGSATVRGGRNKGRTLKVKAGDALVIPAGTGHQCLTASQTFMAVGAYPRWERTVSANRPSKSMAVGGNRSARSVSLVRIRFSAGRDHC